MFTWRGGTLVPGGNTPSAGEGDGAQAGRGHQNASERHRFESSREILSREATETMVVLCSLQLPLWRFVGHMPWGGCPVP